MRDMNELAEHFDEKARFWSVVFNLVKWPAFLNIVLFALFCFTPFKGAFTLIYGTGPANLWFSIGMAALFAIVIFISYNRAHFCIELSKRARGETTDSNNEKR